MSMIPRDRFWDAVIVAAALGLLFGFAAGVKADIPGWRFEAFDKQESRHANPKSDAHSGGSLIPPAAATTAEPTGTKPAAAVAKRQAVTLVFYTAREGCAPCKRFLRWRESNGSKLLCDVKHFQYARLEDSAQTFPDGLPAFVISDWQGKRHLYTGWTESTEHEPGILCPNCLLAFIEHHKNRPKIEFDKPADVRLALPGGRK